MGQFALHASNGGLEEEGNEIIVGALCPDLFQGRDIAGTVFQLNNEQRVAGTQEYEVGKQATGTTVTVTEGMQILKNPWNRAATITGCMLRVNASAVDFIKSGTREISFLWSPNTVSPAAMSQVVYWPGIASGTR